MPDTPLPRLGNSGLRQDRGALGMLSYREQQMLTPQARQMLMETARNYGRGILGAVTPPGGGRYDRITDTVTLRGAPGRPGRAFHEMFHALSEKGYGRGSPPGYVGSLTPERSTQLREEYGSDILSRLSMLFGGRGTEEYPMGAMHPDQIPEAERQFYAPYIGSFQPLPTNYVGRQWKNGSWYNPWRGILVPQAPRLAPE